MSAGVRGQGSGAMVIALLVAFAAPALAQQPSQADASWVVALPAPGRFPLAVSGQPAQLVVSYADWPGVQRAAANLRTDMGRVTGAEPPLASEPAAGARATVIIGTLGRSPLIDALVARGALDTAGLAGRWETYVIQPVDRPWPGVDRALVIAGSDKRGTIYGIYDLSAAIGVSPWAWWSDVPVPHRADLYVLPGRHSAGTPAVKYRGIFINDEAPAFSGWAREKFGGINHRVYEHVFELVLRLKGNYLWPAMWGNAFNADDSLSNRLADEYGVVMGTSHHEPMLRAQQEWRRFGSGPWNYETNGETLRAFWRQGIVNMGSHESIVTVGMRGDGDMPMSRDNNIGLLERIVADQRAIIAGVTGRPAAQTPQLWALYKEVQGYYDQGMRVPDDVTLLFADDNWGNVRRLPERGAAPRAGGYGLYYHFDYVGGPRNYKWLNTNSIPRIWEQLNLTYGWGVDRIWIVNVGDIKPMELPISFFLDYAWNPSAWPASRLPEYTRQWAAQQFGDAFAPRVARILDDYQRYSARRKPELIVPATFSLTAFREAERIGAEWDSLAAQAVRVRGDLPADARDAYYQLVLHPVFAMQNLTRLYLATARNRVAAAQGRAGTNELASEVRQYFFHDAEISAYYNDTLAGGRWRHMADQTHIGYTYWQEPPRNSIPETQEITVPAAAQLGVAVEGSDRWYGADSSSAALPRLEFRGARSRYIEVFNRGQAPFDFQASADQPWLVLSATRGRVDDTRRIEVSVDWRRAPHGPQRASVTIAGAGGRVTVQVPVLGIVDAAEQQMAAGMFAEGDGYVAMEAEHTERAVNGGGVTWTRIPGLGRTLSGMTPLPVTAPSVATPGGDSPRLEYRVYLNEPGEVNVRVFCSPTLDYQAHGIRYAVSIDDGAPQVVNIVADSSQQAWSRWVSDNINVSATRHRVTAGPHTLRLWMVDPGIVVQRITIERDDVPPSYLGPPESIRLGSR